MAKLIIIILSFVLTIVGSVILLTPSTWVKDNEGKLLYKELSTA